MKGSFKLIGDSYRTGTSFPFVEAIIVSPISFSFYFAFYFHHSQCSFFHILVLVKHVSWIKIVSRRVIHVKKDILEDVVKSKRLMNVTIVLNSKLFNNIQSTFSDSSSCYPLISHVFLIASPKCRLYVSARLAHFFRKNKSSTFSRLIRSLSYSASRN